MKSPGMPGTRFTARSNGDGFYAAALRDPAGTALMAKDLVKHKLEFSGKYHIYDMFNKKYLGYASEVAYGFKPETQALFALMPYKVSRVKADVKCDADRRVTINVEVLTEQGSGKCDHTFNVRVYSPDGKENQSFSQVIFANGRKGSMSFVVPFNFPEKNWKFEVTDVISGITENMVLK